MSSEHSGPRADHYDRLIGSLTGLPDVLESRPSTVTTTVPMLGLSQTFVVQTFKQRELGFTIFIQQVDAEGKIRLVLPPRVALAIFRQVDSLMKRSKKKAAQQALETRRSRQDDPSTKPMRDLLKLK
jgi:hypothetical protein